MDQSEWGFFENEVLLVMLTELHTDTDAMHKHNFLNQNKFTVQKSEGPCGVDGKLKSETLLRTIQLLLCSDLTAGPCYSSRGLGT